MIDNDTIAAISTALGNSGINIIRVSGINSFDIIENVFKKGKNNKDFCVNDVDSHTIHYGHIVFENEIIDEVMVSIFKSPNSYTRENVVEINCHGSVFVTKKILNILVKNGARLAEPGEFSKRAFLNGRIDLSQAEAVMEIISSKNDYSLKASLSHMNGALSNEIKEIREIILHDVAYIEAALDDPEHYDISEYTSELNINVKHCIESIEKLIGSFSYGRVINQGINTVIVGKPNAGKSSLMNNFLNEDKAIVTDIPGTTRDTIEYSVNIGNLNLNLIDTAGIHETEDIIEKIGIEKTYDSLKDAQLVLYVIDTSDGLTDNDIELYNNIKLYTHIVVFNKSDKIKSKDFDRTVFDNSICVEYSAISKDGYEQLINVVNEMFINNNIDIENELFITSERHLELLEKARGSLINVINNAEYDLSEDMLTIDMMDAYEYLGLIIGETVNDDLFNKIFSEFCMGK